MKGINFDATVRGRSIARRKQHDKNRAVACFRSKFAHEIVAHAQTGFVHINRLLAEGVAESLLQLLYELGTQGVHPAINIIRLGVADKQVAVESRNVSHGVLCKKVSNKF